MQSLKKDLNALIKIYSEMDEDQIQHEVNALSDQIFAILTATECLSMQVMFDRELEIHFSMQEISSTLN